MKMGRSVGISTRDAIISAARSLDEIIINKNHHLQQHSCSDRVQVFLHNDDTMTCSTTYDDIAYAAEILLDPIGSSQTGRALLMEVKPAGTQAGVLLHQPQQSKDMHDVIEWDLGGNDTLIDKRLEHPVDFNHGDESSSYVEGFPRLIEAWLLTIAIRHLQRDARCTDALSLCSKSIEIVSEHIHTIETMSPTSPQNRAFNEEQRTSLLLLHHRVQTLQSSTAKDCVTAMLRESSDGKESLIEHNRHGRSSHRHLSSLRQNLDSRASILNLQLRELSHDAESTKQKHDEDGVIRGRREKKESTQRKMTKPRHFLYPQLLWHPGFY
mmetsp:Transcript_13758/g.20670  ORF Transcript_13758/g.20670 Transcript_13758/m.20670 type:complete len:325 (+) Transcript_13758:16-990(+)